MNNFFTPWGANPPIQKHIVMNRIFTKKIAIIGLMIMGMIHLSAQELLLNTDFDDNLANWELWESATQGTVDIDSTGQLNGAKSAHLQITVPGGGAQWELGFAQGLPNGLSADTTYYVSFMAKASENTSIELVIQESESPWAGLFTKTVNLTTEPQMFVDSFLLSSAASCNFVFQMGAIGSAQVWIDDVHLVKGQGIDPGPELDPGEKLSNNFFNEQLNEWQVWESSTTGNVEIDGSGVLEGSNSAKVSIASAGNGEAWELGLAQAVPDGILEGKSYIVSFQAVASEATSVEVVLQQVHDPWANIYAGSLELGTTPQTFVDTFAVTASMDVNFVFQLGAIGGAEVWLDDVHLIERTTVDVNDIDRTALQVTNFPNPFLSQTAIDFVLSEREWVSIAVFDARGKKVINTGAIYDAGENIVPLDFAEKSAGVYFCTLRTARYSKTIKMILQK